MKEPNILFKEVLSGHLVGHFYKEPTMCLPSF